MGLDQSPLSYILQVTHQSCRYALTRQQFHQLLALERQPATIHKVTLKTLKQHKPKPCCNLQLCHK